MVIRKELFASDYKNLTENQIVALFRLTSVHALYTGLVQSPVLSAMALLSHEAWHTALDWAPGQVAVNIAYRENDKLVSSEQRAGCHQERSLACSSQCCDDISVKRANKDAGEGPEPG